MHIIEMAENSIGNHDGILSDRCIETPAGYHDLQEISMRIDVAELLSI